MTVPCRGRLLQFRLSCAQEIGLAEVPFKGSAGDSRGVESIQTILPVLGHFSVATPDTFGDTQ